jgi:hypothetical protein
VIHAGKRGTNVIVKAKIRNPQSVKSANNPSLTALSLRFGLTAAGRFGGEVDVMEVISRTV